MKKLYNILGTLGWLLCGYIGYCIFDYMITEPCPVLIFIFLLLCGPATAIASTIMFLFECKMP